MPKPLIFLILMILALGIYLVVGQMRDFEHFGAERDKRVLPETQEPVSGLELRGTVLDADSRPLEGVLVELGSAVTELPESAFEAVDRSYSDLKGRFSFQVEGPKPRDLRLVGSEGQVRVFRQLPPSTALMLRLN